MAISPTQFSKCSTCDLGSFKQNSRWQCPGRLRDVLYGRKGGVSEARANRKLQLPCKVQPLSFTILPAGDSFKALLLPAVCSLLLIHSNLPKPCWKYSSTKGPSGPASCRQAVLGPFLSVLGAPFSCSYMRLVEPELRPLVLTSDPFSAQAWRLRVRSQSRLTASAPCNSSSRHRLPRPALPLLRDSPSLDYSGFSTPYNILSAGKPTGKGNRWRMISKADALYSHVCILKEAYIGLPLHQPLPPSSCPV